MCSDSPLTGCTVLNAGWNVCSRTIMLLKLRQKAKLRLSNSLRWNFLTAIILYYNFFAITRVGLSQSAALFQLRIGSTAFTPCPSFHAPLLPFLPLPSTRPLQDQLEHLHRGVQGSSIFVALHAHKKHRSGSGRSISGSFASITMSGKMNANPRSGRIWDHHANYKMAVPWNRRPCSSEHL